MEHVSGCNTANGNPAALCVCVQVLADKTVVLATNQLQFVSMADLVVVMRGGSAVEVGSYAELMAAGGVFAALMKEAQVGQQGRLKARLDWCEEEEAF